MARSKKQLILLDKDPLWYKNAIIYELHVRAFFDSNGDGIGDFRGLTQKLDYLQDLGVTALWLLPFYPSPLKDDGYDTADYYSINPIYGTLADFKTFIREAHQRGLRVITELVLNHTSDQHRWFQRARRAKTGSPERDFYVWSDTPEKYKNVRIIFNDFEPSNWTWDHVAQAYYWHRFYSHQPDLNYDNPRLHKEIINVLDFWLDLGVDGFRLDAVPYLYEREGTSCDNLPETHEYLKTLRKHLDDKYGDRMLLAEANNWPEIAVTYFGAGKGDECQMAFHFPLMPRLFMAVRMEDRIPIVDIMEQTPPIPETSQWALFLRNHDELTLEMVTDEERDYMYRVYANEAKARINLGIRRRLAPLLGNDRKKIELLNLLLLSMPGTPVVYYGDEIGMGDNIFLGDRNGVRTPMHWSSDKNAGFSRASPQALYFPIILDPEYHYESVNVEAQQRNPHSLLWWMKQVLTLRKRWHAFGQGSLEFLKPNNRKVLAFIRRHEQERILVVANLSRFTQPVELDLSAFKDAIPLELFGRTEFPQITEKPYFLTLGPHMAYWFSLEPRPVGEAKHLPVATPVLTTLTVSDAWEEVFTGRARRELENCLPGYLKLRPWFNGLGREIRSVRIKETIPFNFDSEKGMICIVGVDYVQADPEQYLIPLAFASGKKAEQVGTDYPHLEVARLRLTGREIEGILYDSVCNKAFGSTLLEAIAKRRTFRGNEGELTVTQTFALRTNRDGSPLPKDAMLDKAEHRNTSIQVGEKFLIKLFRKIEAGVNPDLEVGLFLTEKRFSHSPPVAGLLEYQGNTGTSSSIGIATVFVPGSRLAWDLTLDSLGRFFERVRTLPEQSQLSPAVDGTAVSLVDKEIPNGILEILGAFSESVRLLGQRTGELHLALASDLENKDFVPEPFTPYYQRALYQSMRNRTVHCVRYLRGQISHLAGAEAQLLEKVVNSESDILKRLRAIYETRITGMRIRCHGNFHLRQVLDTGKDFMVIDFEGEPAHTLGERRIKRSPMYDVAVMIRSLYYAMHSAVLKQVELGTFHPEDVARLEPWMRFWHFWMSVIFLKSYLQVVGRTDLLPQSREELAVLLQAHLLERAVFETAYEQYHRPDWIKIPMQGLLELLAADNNNESKKSTNP
ncbi:maltose alpha-D-glucosyltransferase [Pedosphaera parvula]|uniref:maltose alpha-D-glucosyltransferase n=1 Tax=Pedosphaera parvula (strain Ellin514) TaxID=320771 RepID=B9XNC6_PEDPL|nr:maltose alpha-D-glucosyltransferase [Pedosphaera parvula]EEF58679.1 trehalose synthase [Pedosphaera parvula Ellin514]